MYLLHAFLKLFSLISLGLGTRPKAGFQARPGHVLLKRAVQCVSTTVLGTHGSACWPYLGNRQMSVHILNPCGFSVFDYVISKTIGIFYGKYFAHGHAVVPRPFPPLERPGNEAMKIASNWR